MFNFDNANFFSLSKAYILEPCLHLHMLVGSFSNHVKPRVHVWAQEDLWPDLRAAGGHLHLSDVLTLAQALLQEAGGRRGGGRGGGEDEGPPRPSTLHIRDRVAR